MKTDRCELGVLAVLSSSFPTTNNLAHTTYSQRKRAHLIERGARQASSQASNPSDATTRRVLAPSNRTPPIDVRMKFSTLAAEIKDTVKLVEPLLPAPALAPLSTHTAAKHQAKESERAGRARNQLLALEKSLRAFDTTLLEHQQAVASELLAQRSSVAQAEGTQPVRKRRRVEQGSLEQRKLLRSLLKATRALGGKRATSKDEGANSRTHLSSPQLREISSPEPLSNLPSSPAGVGQSKAPESPPPSGETDEKPMSDMDTDNYPWIEDDWFDKLSDMLLLPSQR